MCCSPLILLLITGALLIPTEGQGDLLSIVNMAIEHGNQIHEKPEKHMNFYRILKQKQASTFLSVELLLQATDCKNTGMTTHQNSCKFVKPTQFINCLVCTDDLTRREPSFIHCDWQRNAAKHAELRRNGCEKYGPDKTTVLQ
uniref:Retinoic acid receptor responder protein 2 n=1 Tax=Anguilla anguilla TaxID=7936 RepID=A0A0E9WD82_ANGAN